MPLIVGTIDCFDSQSNEWNSAAKVLHTEYIRNDVMMVTCSGSEWVTFQKWCVEEDIHLFRMYSLQTQRRFEFQGKILKVDADIQSELFRFEIHTLNPHETTEVH